MNIGRKPRIIQQIMQSAEFKICFVMPVTEKMGCAFDLSVEA